MFKNTMLALTLGAISYCNAQVGVNTTDPQNTIHIAGATSGVRVDGLNSTNNARNLGTRSAPVHVDTNGDFIIPTAPADGELIRPEFDLINNAAPVQVRTSATGGQVINVIGNTFFTLEQDAIVMVNYSLSFDCKDYTNTSNISDPSPKLVQNFLTLYSFINDPVSGTVYTTLGGGLGVSGQTYTNATGDIEAVGGYLYNNGSFTRILPAGNYYIEFNALVYSSINTDTKEAFTAVFGQDRDTVSVLAIY
ncbi:hypothetical protein EAX61_07040 [Dokdonia sinensis]|uniref:DUF4397 domain-containing protein n=1 Tax=Dokdonia sinensis TaxID=2479847 RepID=A0A3M0G691_9FLAO|nr:hypothetical protein [Dokdonia sinensis]RMB60570.1 hypothetical protein EAX61_07040 [Dokdonia sinensis]